MSLIKWVIGSTVGFKALETGKEFLEQRRAEKEELRREEIRKNTPCEFDNGISESEFNAIVKHAIKCTGGIHHYSVVGATIYATVKVSENGLPWSFKLDFNDDGKLTGQYRISSENSIAILPEQLAESIKYFINTYPNWIDDDYEDDLDAEEDIEFHAEKKTRFCSSCGAEIKLSDAKFCTACGKKL